MNSLIEILKLRNENVNHFFDAYQNFTLCGLHHHDVMITIDEHDVTCKKCKEIMSEINSEDVDIKLIDFEKSSKTSWVCFITEHKLYIGSITWDDITKDYSYFPALDTSYSIKSLGEIIEFMGNLKKPYISNKF